MIREFIATVGFLTHIPTAVKKGPKTVFFFPIVGMLLGGILVLSNLALSIILPRILVDLLLIIVLIVMAGAFHLDGFADSVDGLYVGRSKETILRIMRDTQIGSMGVVALICLLGLKLAALYQIPEIYKNISLLIMPMVGRWMIVLSGAISTYARAEGGLGEAFTNKVGLRDFILTSFFPVILLLWLLKIKGIVLMLLAIFFTLGITEYIKKKIDGMTGDTLGLINEIIEVIVLLGVVII